MGGNVWEWTANAHCPYDHRGCTAATRVIRGGAWNNVLTAYVRAQDRAEEAAGSRRDNVGFRCARSPLAISPTHPQAAPSPGPLRSPWARGFAHLCDRSRRPMQIRLAEDSGPRHSTRTLAQARAAGTMSKERPR